MKATLDLFVAIRCKPSTLQLTPTFINESLVKMQPTPSEKSEHHDYDIQVLTSTRDLDPLEWNSLLKIQPSPTPFMKHEYLSAMELSESATAQTGWIPRFVTIRSNQALIAACPLNLKLHSYGEIVFDWAWANAYEQHGLEYYPKALVAVPFTPVPGTRLMAKDEQTRSLLASAIKAWTQKESLSSAHLLFGCAQDIQACAENSYSLRHTVQFHWQNANYTDFADFLSSLNQEKRKKIKQERAKITKAGVSFISKYGSDINNEDWSFFYKCYERTYLEHGNAPYLTPDFFKRMQQSMPTNWVLFIASNERGDRIASSLVAVSDVGQQAQMSESKEMTGLRNSSLTTHERHPRVAYGRYWGALERVDCLHFEACYYQPIEWCIQNGVQRFEGGAQGEHKMARALLPVKTSSAHYLVHPSFASAVDNFLNREEQGIENYIDDLERRTPLKLGGSESPNRL